MATSSASTDPATTTRWEVSKFAVKGTSINADSADSLLAIERAGQLKLITIMQRRVDRITNGSGETYTLRDDKKIQKEIDVETESSSVVRAVSFRHR